MERPHQTIHFFRLRLLKQVLRKNGEPCNREASASRDAFNGFVTALLRIKNTRSIQGDPRKLIQILNDLDFSAYGCWKMSTGKII